MHTPDWDHLQDLFHRSLALPEAEREAFLREATGGDEATLRQVLDLLAGDATHSPLDTPAEEFARLALDDPGVPASEVGRYRLKYVLGRGGTGVVFYGEHVELGTPAAVKLLRDAWVSPERRARFAREARMLAQLDHPSIARLLEADSLPDGTPYFVMEYVDGSPVTEYCSRHALTVRQRVRLFRAICEAVQHAHRQAIIHRDLKPSNILVAREQEAQKESGAVPLVKLLDFGIAKHLDDLDEPALQTRTGFRLLTPAYAAPEQLHGGAIGVYTDVYALGILLYEMLAGRRPYDLEGMSPVEADRTLLEHGAAGPSEAVGRPQSGVSAGEWADLDVLCLKAMHPEATRRYASVEALARDVDHFLRGEPLEARRDSWGYRGAKFIRRHRRMFGLAAAASLILAAVIGFYTIRLADARDAAVADAERARRIQAFVTGLFQGGDEAAGPADTLRVITLLRQGVEEARVLDAAPDVQADLFETLGGIFQEFGDFETADSLLSGALGRRRAWFGPDHPSVARSLVSLGLLRLNQAKLEEADSLVAAGLAASRQRLATPHPELAEAVAAYGIVLQARGDYDRAAEVLEEAARLYAQLPDPGLGLSKTLSELANTYFYAGDYATSDSLNRLALAMDQDLFGRRHPNVASTLVNLAATRFNLGFVEEAELLYRQALEIYVAYYGEDHPTTASNMVMLAQALAARDQFEEAISLLVPALQVRERVYGPDHPRVATTLSELGTIALKRGDLDDAEASFERMVSIYRRAYDDHHYHIAIALSNLASVYRERGDLERCEEVMRDAVSRFVSTLSETHFQTGVARLKLGRLLLLRGRPDQARDELLAGYEVLEAQANPSSDWLKGAAKNLAEAYEALGDSASASHYRDVLASSESIVDAAAEDER